MVAGLNRKLRGWANHFCLGPVSKAYRAVDRHTRQRLRHWLCRKNCKPAVGDNLSTLSGSRMRYVAKKKMWRRGPERPHLLGFPDFLRHILFRLRESSQTSFGEDRVGVFKYRLHLAIVFSRHAYGHLVEERKAFLKYPTSGNTRHLTLSRTLWVLNKMWRRKPGNPNKGEVFRPVRHIFCLATYRIRLPV